MSRRVRGAPAPASSSTRPARNMSTWAICKMNMLLHALPDARIEKGDTIRDPKLVDEGALLVYDRVIANPPFSLDEWAARWPRATVTDASGSACRRRPRATWRSCSTWWRC